MQWPPSKPLRSWILPSRWMARCSSTPPATQAGNIGYKTAQRTGGALAVGPILQGLNKPVNDLSRGATVPDIINTVAITAIQAGEK